MGVDWIPCRVEPGVTPDDINSAVELESLHFRADGDRLPPDLLHSVTFSQAEKDEIYRRYQESGKLCNRLLFKHASHRVSVIGSKELFPIEWRLDAYRTIPPWELPSQIEKWRTYRQEVADGTHDDFLLDLLAYLWSIHLASYFDTMICPKDIDSQKTTASWAKRPEVLAVHEQISRFPRPEALPPPVWCEETGPGPCAGARDRLAAVCDETNRVNGLIRTWNAAVKRGNYRIRPVEPVPGIETWIHQQVNDAWFASFLEWVKPWVDGGYGLYRDCE